MIIDTHIHIFPDKLCPQTIEKLACTNPDRILTYYGDGSLADAEANLIKNGIDTGVMLPIATNPRQERSVNAFAAQVQRQSQRLISFGSLHPDTPDVEGVLDSIVAAGLKGIKLHPDYQGFFIEEKRMYRIYAAICERELPVVFHTGYDPVSPRCIHAAPAGVRQVAEAFPKLTIIAAHTGGLAFYDGRPDVYRDLPNLYFDTAIATYSYAKDPAAYRQLIDLYGADRFLFATDHPWGDGGQDQAFFRKLGLSTEEWAAIAHGNAEKLLRLSCKEM